MKCSVPFGRFTIACKLMISVNVASWVGYSLARSSRYIHRNIQHNFPFIVSPHSSAVPIMIYKVFTYIVHENRHKNLGMYRGCTKPSQDRPEKSDL